MTRLSVVVPATDRPPTLQQVLDAIRGATDTPEELIVIDRPLGLGPAAARNEGARRASGDIVVFVDADVEVHSDVFRRIRSAFERDPTLAAIFGSYDDDPRPAGVVSDFRNLLHHYVHHEGAGDATTFWTGLGAIRRDLFLAHGGFDEDRFPRPSVEDIELGMRLGAHGAHILLDPTIQGRHLKSWTLLKMVETDLLRRGVPWLRLVLERRPKSTPLNLGLTNQIAAGASLLLLFGLARRNPWLTGTTLATLAGIDRRFYLLLWRRRGARLVAAALPLHLVHRATSAAAVPIALTTHLVGRLRGAFGR